MIIQLYGRVADGGWDDLVSFLISAIPFYEAPGGIKVRLLRDVSDPNAFIEMIEYDGEESYAADQRRVEVDPAMIERLEKWREVLAGPVEVRTFRDVTPSAGSTEREAYDKAADLGDHPCQRPVVLVGTAGFEPTTP